MNFTHKMKKDMLALARITIAEKLDIDPGVSEAECDFSNSLFKEELGVFVTLHIKGSLRGCIGFIEGVFPLPETIRKMALSAAFRDPRFNPLSAEEYPLIDIEISVLSPVEPLHDLTDIEIGRDGLIASKAGRSGLLLPQVAEEYGWNRDDFLSHTCMKAGLPQNAWKDGSVTFQKFSAYVFGETCDRF